MTELERLAIIGSLEELEHTCVREVEAILVEDRLDRDVVLERIAFAFDVKRAALTSRSAWRLELEFEAARSDPRRA